MRKLTQDELNIGAVALAGMALANAHDWHDQQDVGAYGAFSIALRRVFLRAGLGGEAYYDFITCWDGGTNDVWLADWVEDYCARMYRLGEEG